MEVDFPRYAERQYGAPQTLTEDAIGPLLYSAAAYSTDPKVRAAGSSGGLAGQIVISLLDRGEIDGAVLVGYSQEDPLQPLARIARRRSEVLGCSQSKYSLFPVAHVYAEMIRTPGRYAVVGLPCQIHSLYRWQDIERRLLDRVVLIIGLFCHANLDPEVIPDLLLLKGLRKDDVARLEFRGGRWPGGIRAVLKDGSVIPLHQGDIKDGAFNYLNRLYIAKRCLLCIDFSAELSDIAISDPWLRDERGEYMFRDGWSLAHVRTMRGDRILRAMLERKEIVTQQVERSLVVKNNRAITQHKKRGAFIRILRRRKRGRPIPEYRINPPNLSAGDYAHEWAYQVSLFGRYMGWPRPVLLRLAFSSIGRQFSRLKAAIKQWKYRISY